MKKTVFILLLSASVFACGDSGGNKADNATTTNETTEPEQPEDPEAQKGLELIAKSDCLQCHQVKDAFQGPAYEAIAEKYRNDTTVIDTLAQRIIRGVKSNEGRWGKIPMTPHPDLSHDDARLMVKYVLSLKK